MEALLDQRDSITDFRMNFQRYKRLLANPSLLPSSVQVKEERRVESLS
jgi:hypothetical protein